MMKTSQSAGFTLVETVVALFIIGVLSAAGSTLLIGASQSSKQLKVFHEGLQKFEVGQAIIRNDISAITEIDIEDVGSTTVWSDGDVFSFQRNGWFATDLDQPRGDSQFVVYRLDRGTLTRDVMEPSIPRRIISSRPVFDDLRTTEVRALVAGQWLGIADAESSSDIDAIELSFTFNTGSTLRLVSLSGGRG